MLNQSDATESCPSEIETLYKSQLVEILVRFDVIDANFKICCSLQRESYSFEIEL
jgi:hypothetical protein